MERREMLKRACGASAGFVAARESKEKAESPEQFYAVVELMGYKRLAGRVTIRGVLWQIDVPVAGGFVSQMFNPANCYRVTVIDKRDVTTYAETDPLPIVEMDARAIQRSLEYSDDPDRLF